MRQGNEFHQWVSRDRKEGAFLWLPLELEDEWKDFNVVCWIDNKDGTYTLVPRKES